MLLSREDNEKLSLRSWIIKRSEGKVYYMKYTFDTPKEYSILITDLCLVWYERGDYKRIKENAENDLRMELADDKVIKTLLDRIKTTFEERALRCKIERFPGQVKVTIPLQDAKSKYEITQLYWPFNCGLLAQEPERHGWLTGPQVIYQQFILPSQAIVNHYTENILDDYSEKLKMPLGTTFSQESLTFLSTLSNKTGTDGVVVAQGSNTDQVGEADKEKMRLEEEAREEAKRLKELEDFNARQIHIPTKKKRRI